MSSFFRLVSVAQGGEATDVRFLTALLTDLKIPLTPASYEQAIYHKSI